MRGKKANGRDMNRTNTISGIPPCFDDPYNHRNNHPLYVHSKLLFPRETTRLSCSDYRGAMALQIVARNRRKAFIGAGFLLLIGNLSSALLLAGCSSSSPMIPSIFLMSLWYDKTSPAYNPAQTDPQTLSQIANIVGNANMEARVGYVTYSGMAQR